MGFPLGVVGLILGYALMYTGAFNLRNGGRGPGFFEALGFKGGTVAGPSADTPSANMTGQPASSNPSPTSGGMTQV